MRKPRLAAIAAIALLAGASTAPGTSKPGPKQSTGAGVGAVGGAIFGGLAENAPGDGGKTRSPSAPALSWAGSAAS